MRRTGAARFDKSRRVRRRADFLEIQSRGRRVATPRFVIALRARGEEPVGRARLGITVSRKTGTAVVRNRAKRLVREAFRLTEQLWAPGIDVVVIVKHVPQGLTLHDVVAEWQSAARQIERRTREAQADQSFRLAAAGGPDKVPKTP